MQKKLKEYIFSLIQLIFPNYCIFCEKHLDIDEQIICLGCLNSIPKFDINLNDKFLDRIQQKHFDDLIICLEFENKIQQLMHLFKYSGYKVIAKIFAQVLYEQVKQKKYDLIFSVPLHEAKERERGYNQSDLIAKHLANFMKAKHRQSIKRIKYTKSQTKLSRTQRIENVKGVFHVEENVKGKYILLIDDIITTGSTLNECAKTLKEKSALKVDVVAIATPLSTLQESLEENIENSSIIV